MVKGNLLTLVARMELRILEQTGVYARHEGLGWARIQPLPGMNGATEMTPTQQELLELLPQLAEKYPKWFEVVGTHGSDSAEYWCAVVDGKITSLLYMYGKFERQAPALIYEACRLAALERDDEVWDLGSYVVSANVAGWAVENLDPYDKKHHYDSADPYARALAAGMCLTGAKP